MSSILVDATAAFEQRAGVGRYSRNILDRLLPEMPEVDWTLFRTAGNSEAGWYPPARTRVVRYPLGRRRFDQLGVRLGLPLPVRLVTGRQALVYSPDFVAPPMRDVPRIVTVHDIAFHTHPHLTTPGNVAFLGAAVRREIDRGAMFAAVSETTRIRLIETLGVPEARVRVIRNGVGSRFLTVAPLSRRRLRQLGLPDDFLLMVGTIEPRKNHATVLRAIERHPTGLPLVIAGRRGWGTEEEVGHIERLVVKGRVIWLDDFGDTDLPALYAASRGVLYPSWTEGFGLPVLEALATGRPVVTGTDPVFAEVGGGLVTRVDPADVDALGDAIRTIEERDPNGRAADARRDHAAHYGWEEPVTILKDWIRQETGDRR